MFLTTIPLVADGTEEPELALRQVACGLAKATGSQLHLVRIVSTKLRPPFSHSWEEIGIK